MYKVIPLGDGKLVTDLPSDFRTRSVWNTIVDSNYVLILAQMFLRLICLLEVEEETNTINHETIIDIATEIIEVFPPLSDESPIPHPLEAQIIYFRARGLSSIGNYEKALIEMRCCGAIVRLLKSTEHGCDSMLSFIGGRVIPEIMLTLVESKYAEKMQRPLFAAAEINKYEKELGFGIFDEDHYKCHHCGKSRVDGKLILCNGCDRSWVCDEECHFAGWKSHKKYCRNDLRWRREPIETVQPEEYNEMRNLLLKNTKHACGIYSIPRLGLTAVLCIDPDTNELFDAWTDKAYKIKEQEA